MIKIIVNSFFSTNLTTIVSKIFYVFSILLFIFLIKSISILSIIKIAELCNINLTNYGIFNNMLSYIVYDFNIWKMYFDLSIFITLILLCTYIYLLVSRQRSWKFDSSFYMIIPIYGIFLYIALWPGFFDINFFNFISLDYLDKNINLYHKLLLIYELKGFNLIDFLSEDTHIISKIVVFNTYLFYVLYFLLSLIFIFDNKLNPFYKVFCVIVLSFFVKYYSYFIIEIFYHFSVIPYKLIISDVIKSNLENTMNYIEILFFTI